ncbi:MAG: hypothetical protein J5965_13300 [Aeriscardovia sp.]|nr:hypothetical protein [Aeriscardovia sp.]
MKDFNGSYYNINNKFDYSKYKSICSFGDDSSVSGSRFINPDKDGIFILHAYGYNNCKCEIWDTTDPNAAIILGSISQALQNSNNGPRRAIVPATAGRSYEIYSGSRGCQVWYLPYL